MSLLTRGEIIQIFAKSLSCTLEEDILTGKIFD